MIEHCSVEKMPVVFSGADSDHLIIMYLSLDAHLCPSRESVAQEDVAVSLL